MSDVYSLLTLQVNQSWSMVDQNPQVAIYIDKSWSYDAWKKCKLPLICSARIFFIFDEPSMQHGDNFSHRRGGVD